MVLYRRFLGLVAFWLLAQLSAMAGQRLDDGVATFRQASLTLDAIIAGDGTSKSFPVSQMLDAQKLRSLAAPMDQEVQSQLSSDHRASLKLLRPAARRDQLFGVFALTLRVIRKRTDAVAYGVSDYWASLAQSLRYGGDCEDFAVAYFTLLRHLGVPAHDMRFVSVMDQRLNQAHMLLVVHDKDGLWMLDFQQAQPVRLTSTDMASFGYRPLYSFTQDRLWVHRALLAGL